MAVAWRGRTEQVVASAARTTSGNSSTLTDYGQAQTLAVLHLRHRLGGRVTNPREG